ncbi:protein of unknown function [Methylorubrum extorquens]|uniref:Uncharacterized protein n=1 Tax=Methylorubrum extorquens TaxID=408 RepID=A0A2N9AHF6_METEX|nr:protein of unknown function [Methylorubrum extorquens]
MERKLAEKVEIDAETLQYLSETALAHNMFIQALLGLEEQRFPGFAAAIRRELDKTLRSRSTALVEAGWVNVRDRIHADLRAAEQAASSVPNAPVRTKLRSWLFGGR